MALISKTNYSVEATTTEAGLLALEADWNRLSESSGDANPFMTFDWFRAWVQRFMREDRQRQSRLNLVVVRKDGAITGISPFILRRVSRFGIGVRKLEFFREAWAYNDFVLGNDPPRQIEAVAEYLARTRKQWDIIDLRILRDPGNDMAQIEAALSSNRLRYIVAPEPSKCPFLPIDAPAATIIGRLSKSTRSTIRNQQRRLERMQAEGLRIRILDRPHAEPGLLERLIELESQKRFTGLSRPVLGPNLEIFRELFDRLGPRDLLYVILMELGDRLIAFQLGFRCGTKLWDYTTAYDYNFSRLSPGTMLLPAIIDYGFGRGYNEYDFMGGEESYKLHWATDFHQSKRLLIWNRSWASRARAFVYLDLLRLVYRLMGRAE